MTGRFFQGRLSQSSTAKPCERSEGVPLTSHFSRPFQRLPALPLIPSSSLPIPSNGPIAGHREKLRETSPRLFRVPTIALQSFRAVRICTCTKPPEYIAADDREMGCQQIAAVQLDRCGAASRRDESSKDIR